MNLILRAMTIELVSDADPNKKWNSDWLEVTEQGAVCVCPRWKACLPRFQIMCASIMSDLQDCGGTSPTLTAIEKVKKGISKKEEIGGNAWYAHVSKDKVCFEGLHGQAEGGPVSLNQFELAARTYLKFLRDPEHMTIETVFPDDYIDF